MVVCVRGTDGGSAVGGSGTASPGFQPTGMGIGSPGFQSAGMTGMGGIVIGAASAPASAAASALAAASAAAFALMASWALQQRQGGRRAVLGGSRKGAVCCGAGAMWWGSTEKWTAYAVLDVCGHHSSLWGSQLVGDFIWTLLGMWRAAARS